MPPLVGVISTSFPRHQGDSAGSFVLETVRQHLRAGREVEVVAAGEARADARISQQSFGLEGSEVPVFRVPSPAVHGKPLFYGEGAPEMLDRVGRNAWPAAVTFTAALCEAVRGRAGHWSLIEAHWLVPSGLAARLVAPHTACAAWVHSGDVATLERLAGRGGRALARWLMGTRKNRLALRFVSHDLRRRYAALAGELVGDVVPLPLARHLFAPVDAGTRRAAKTRLGLGSRVILSAGRLVPIKGFDILVEACARLSPPVTLVLLGEGPEREALARAAHRQGTRLWLAGARPHDEVASWMAAADLYVQPSRRLASGRTEGLPMSLREALASGLPTIATATGGMAELGPPTRLVPADDVAALQRAIEKALSLTQSCI